MCGSGRICRMKMSPLSCKECISSSESRDFFFSFTWTLP
ncbi:hypothetical protein ACHAWC_005138 [Mediolabrus comicus]